MVQCQTVQCGALRGVFTAYINQNSGAYIIQRKHFCQNIYLRIKKYFFNNNIIKQYTPHELQGVSQIIKPHFFL